ncbi:RING/FYVE/PHD zinc finger superfamily protein [Striga hermonthica]|uniref:RING/FYVE/PHD zinc finger superfamily protein n=1 Tax=Striga hermonthica TaxID=68872 RepID=A0A9N7MTD3_STRHE|nr:RING/FYVE/PHD zinc finger superfamily protein [Striga hermonthica]
MESAAEFVGSGSDVVGEKRAAAEEDVDVLKEEGSPPKRVRGGVDRSLVGDVKKVAEMVLVLAAMGKMRGGKGPTDVEKELMVEARGRLARVCEGFPPKDVFPRDAFGGVIEDLGLNKLKEQRLGFRPPKMSIAEKLLVSKTKMEKQAEDYSLSSTRLQPNPGAAVESRSASHYVRMSQPDKPTHMSINPITSQSASPLGHSSTINSSSLPYQLPTSEIRPIGSSSLSSSHYLGSAALPRVDRPHLKSDLRANGSSHPIHLQANYSNSTAITPTWSVQQQSALPSKSVPDNKMPVGMSPKVEGAGTVKSGMTPQMMSRTAAQTIGTPSQGTTNHAQPFLAGNTHAEIGKIVQKLLQPRISERPTWNPPSRDYMNKALTCQVCLSMVTEIESILICDACEKGYHLKCLQMSNPKGVPRGEWHCGRCLSLSNGKPLPPKYGRVMRNANTAKVSSNKVAVPSTSIKQVGSSDENVGQPKVIGNENNEKEHVPKVLSDNHDNLTSGSESKGSTGIQEIDNVSTRLNMDDKGSSRTHPNLIENSSSATASSVDSFVEKTSVEKVDNPDSSSDLVMVSNPSDKSQAVINAAKESPSNQSLENQLADSKECHVKESPPDQYMENQSADSKECHVKESPSNQSLENQLADSKECHGNESSDNAKQLKEQEVVRDNSSEVATTAGAMTQGGSSSVGLHVANWIGEPIQVLDEKVYYSSCSIKGHVYKAEDHVLIQFDNGKLIPSKLQEMWEDKNTSEKWVTVNQCYFPSDLPEAVGRPCGLESSEVYESTCGRAFLAGLIESPCKVLPPRGYAEESERRTRLGNQLNDHNLPPLYVCKWIYDEAKGLFRDISC